MLDVLQTKLFHGKDSAIKKFKNMTFSVVLKIHGIGVCKLNESESVFVLCLCHSYQSKLSKTGSNRVNYVYTCPVQSLHMLS